MEHEAPEGHTSAEGGYHDAKASRFHFKSGSKRRSKHASKNEGGEASSKQHRSERKRRHRTRHENPDRTRYKTSTRSGEYYNPDHRHRESLYDNLDEPEDDSAPVDPEEAFRESLFDALADDEGAAYWEGVYGQPVHIYSDTKPGPDGKLERMTDEEYADYVRRKMWEKSHQHIIEEREAREEARRRRKEQQQQQRGEYEEEEIEREDIRRRMEESLRRGKERKKAKDAEAAWEKYIGKWEVLKSASNLEEATGASIRSVIPWPVASGQAKDISPEEIERFLRASNAREEECTAMLKVERVRWHPDKMQQRFGKHIDVDTMKSVTAVFQVLDRLWNNRRS